MATVNSNKNRVLRVVGVREAARLCGASPAHVWYIRHGQRKSARFERKMRDLGLTFEPYPPSGASPRSGCPSRGATLRAAPKRQGKGGK